VSNDEHLYRLLADRATARLGGDARDRAEAYCEDVLGPILDPDTWAPSPFKLPHGVPADSASALLFEPVPHGREASLRDGIETMMAELMGDDA
jgi:hypothetical protein